MNLDRLPEIVRALNITTGPYTLVYHKGVYSLEENPAEPTWEYDKWPHDAANACVVEMLRRMVANGHQPTIGFHEIDFYYENQYRTFPGDLLNALYDAFTAHPEWFKEPTNAKR